MESQSVSTRGVPLNSRLLSPAPTAPAPSHTTLPLPQRTSLTSSEPMKAAIKPLRISTTKDLSNLESSVDTMALECDFESTLEKYVDLISSSNLGVLLKSFQTKNIEITIPTDEKITIREIFAALLDIRKHEQLPIALKYVKQCDEIFIEMSEERLLAFFASPNAEFHHLNLEGAKVTGKVLRSLHQWPALPKLKSLSINCESFNRSDIQHFTINLKLSNLTQLKISDQRSELSLDLVKDLVMRLGALKELSVDSPAVSLDELRKCFPNLSILASSSGASLKQEEESEEVEESGSDEEGPSDPFEGEEFAEKVQRPPTRPVVDRTSSSVGPSDHSLEPAKRAVAVPVTEKREESGFNVQGPTIRSPNLDPVVLPPRETLLAAVLIALLAYNIFNAVWNNP